MDDDDTSPNSKQQQEDQKQEEEEEKNVLQFLDSLDGYMTLYDSLTSTLRKGWLDLASARHSMGSSRISSSLLDLKEQSAATTVLISESIKDSESGSHFKLSKWGSLGDNTCWSQKDVGEWQNSSTSQLRHRSSSLLSEGSPKTHPAGANVSSPSASDNDDIHRERSKSLAVFGTLVSPKLRSTQLSFETALETVVEIANMQSLMLSAFSRLQKEKK